MKKSLSFYLTLWAIRLKGLKGAFSESPVNYKKIRREDLHHPKSKFLRKNLAAQFNVLSTVITEINTQKSTDKLLLFIPGGAFISGPGKHHWDTIETIARHTDFTIWVCDYPKAPEHDITEIAANIDSVYDLAVTKFKAENSILIGDSAGGNLGISLTQRLIKKNLDLPAQIILISPVLDASFSNPEIDAIDRTDPMLSKKGVLSAKEMAAGQTSLADPLISPINGSFENFPKSILFLAENDITYPDQRLFVQKLKSAEADHKVITGQGMPHIWPFLPIMQEAKKAPDKIISTINARSGQQ